MMHEDGSCYVEEKKALYQDKPPACHLKVQKSTYNIAIDALFLFFCFCTCITRSRMFWKISASCNPTRDGPDVWLDTEIKTN